MTDNSRLDSKCADCGQQAIARIAEMEQRLNRASTAVDALDLTDECRHQAQLDIEALDAYLGSEEWHADREADAAGLLPEGLARGVLSEDGIWDVLSRWLERIN